VVGLLLVIPGAYALFSKGNAWKKAFLSILILFYGFIFYLFNFRFLADKMFYQPKNKSLVGVSANRIDTNQLIIGTVIHDEAKAYPIQVIGYHHQVKDTLAGQPIMVTYCTVCRTGRIYSPFIKDQYEQFRLVGMDHFNAMFEDQRTGSWWRQVNGEAIAGPLKGMRLKEIPSTQMRLGAWIREHPQTLILQADSFFTKRYADLQGYDSGTIKGSLEKRDSSSWKFKSWIIGISYQGHARAYDWNELVSKRIINDSLPGLPVLLTLENDGASFHVWERSLNGQSIPFEWDAATQTIRDLKTHSAWSWSGRCLEGPMKDSGLNPVQAYQEFWHSWQSFHPQTTQYR
jgi:hypothetical protein